MQGGWLVAGTLEPEVQDALERCLQPGAVFYDVGANLGFFSLIGARLVGTSGRVYAFEPVPESAGAVRENAALNGFTNVCVLQRALSSATGRARLLVVADRSWSMLDRGWHHPLTSAVLEVETTTIDHLVSSGGLPPPDVLKIDVEGAELDVVRGMVSTLRQHRPTVICELHGTREAFVELMHHAAYAVEVLGQPHAPHSEAAPMRVLARPQESAGVEAG